MIESALFTVKRGKSQYVVCFDLVKNVASVSRSGRTMDFPLKHLNSESRQNRWSINLSQISQYPR